jgi:serine/threonine protein kinase
MPHVIVKLIQLEARLSHERNLRINIQQDQRLGKYMLREPLGHGGMAEVWKAYDTELQRNVAIKILHANLQTDSEFIARFTREARVIATLHHPNIVQIHDF